VEPKFSKRARGADRKIATTTQKQWRLKPELRQCFLQSGAFQLIDGITSIIFLGMCEKIDGFELETRDFPSSKTRSPKSIQE
jgi:hypothetical protein